MDGDVVLDDQRGRNREGAATSMAARQGLKARGVRKGSAPVLAWLDEHVGESTAPAERRGRRR